jgi:hypothetical protein
MVNKCLGIFRLCVVLCIPLVLSSCYTIATESQFSRGKLSEQPEELRKATVILASDYMEQYRQLSAMYGQRDYKINVGSRLSFEVVNHGLARVVYVGPDGKVDLPLIGPTSIAGKFLDEVRKELETKYDRFFKGDVQVNLNTQMPVVGYDRGHWGLAGKATVIIASSGLTGNSVYLQGDEELTDVIFSSNKGGSSRVSSLGHNSEWKEVGIIREVRLGDDEEKKETVIILCDLEKILFRGDLAENIPIKHKDIVFIPRRRDSLLEELHDSLSF